MHRSARAHVSRSSRLVGDAENIGHRTRLASRTTLSSRVRAGNGLAWRLPLVLQARWLLPRVLLSRASLPAPTLTRVRKSNAASGHRFLREGLNGSITSLSRGDCGPATDARGPCRQAHGSSRPRDWAGTTSAHPLREGTMGANGWEPLPGRKPRDLLPRDFRCGPSRRRQRSSKPPPFGAKKAGR